MAFTLCAIRRFVARIFIWLIGLCATAIWYCEMKRIAHTRWRCCFVLSKCLTVNAVVLFVHVCLWVREFGMRTGPFREPKQFSGWHIAHIADRAREGKRERGSEIEINGETSLPKSGSSRYRNHYRVCIILFRFEFALFTFSHTIIPPFAHIFVRTELR